MFTGFRNLVDRRGLNGGVELKGVRLTRWQLEGLKEFIKYDKDMKICYDEVDEYGLIIVDNYSQSDLQFEY